MSRTAADVGRALALDVRGRGEQQRLLLRGPDAASGRARAASGGLSPISPASAIASIVTVSVAPGRRSAARGGRSRPEELERAGRDPDRHAQRDRAATDPEPSDAVERLLHLPAGTRRALRMERAVEQEEQRVAAPLEQARLPSRRLRRGARVNTPSSVSRMSSAPILPCRARRSVSAVKPEMSTNTSEPSTAR